MMGSFMKMFSVPNQEEMMELWDISQYKLLCTPDAYLVFYLPLIGKPAIF